MKMTKKHYSKLADNKRKKMEHTEVFLRKRIAKDYLALKKLEAERAEFESSFQIREEIDAEMQEEIKAEEENRRRLQKVAEERKQRLQKEYEDRKKREEERNRPETESEKKLRLWREKMGLIH